MIKILLLMLFAHIIDDFYLQGILANMKQKRWWEHSEWYKPLYKNDYKMALLIHSMSWSIMILLPFMFLHYVSGLMLLGAFIINAVIHCYVDDLKANRGQINLVVDQSIHIVQVILTWMVLWQWV
jgi:hypothetical protein